MQDKNKVFMRASMLLTVFTFILGGLAFPAEDIVMESYTVVCPRDHCGTIIYKERVAFSGFGYMGLNRKDTKQKGISDHTFFVERVEDKRDYKEINFSKTYEEAGFTYGTNTKLYPKKIVYTISYEFTKKWEGSLYVNPFIDESLALGAKYKAIDIDDLESEGIVQASAKKYVQIPEGYSIKQLILYPVEGGMIKFKLENEHLSETPNNLSLSLLGEDGNFKQKNGVRFCLIQTPPNYVFPAGYSNRITLEIEFD